jgi:hypothetical protein
MNSTGPNPPAGIGDEHSGFALPQSKLVLVKFSNEAKVDQTIVTIVAGNCSPG